ncbi:hypothetical protein [Micromonospora chokoriensis]
MANREEVFSLIGKETISTAAKSAEKSLADLGDEHKDTGKAVEKLDKQTGELQKNIESLAVAFANTGDEKFFKQMREGERDLRKLTKTSKLVAGIGNDMAEGVSLSFSQRIGPLIASAPVAPAGPILGAALAPGIGAAVAGAIVGAAGVGGVVGGLALASKHPAVQQAGGDLGKEVFASLNDAAVAFVNPALDGIGIVRQGFIDIKPEIESIFADSSNYVVPLANGIVKGAQHIIRGVAVAVEKAEPIIKAFSRSFESIGDAVGDTFALLADDAEEGASAIDDMTLALSNFVRVSGELLHLTSQIKGYSNELDTVLDRGRYWVEDNSYLAESLRKVGITLDITSDGFAAGSKEAEAYRNATLGTATAADFATLKAAGMADAQIIAADASGEFAKQAQDASTKANGLGKAHDFAAQAARGQVSALDELATELLAQSDPMFGLIDAQNDLKQAQQEHTEAVKEHGRRSPEAQAALRAEAQAAIAVQMATGKAADSFNGRLTPAMRATLSAAGLTEKEIRELEAQFITAKAAGERFAKNYKATVTTVYREVGRAVPISAEYQSGIGGRASGGPVKAGTPYIVGEEGPELITPTRDGYVHTASETKQMLSKSGSSAGAAIGGAAGGIVINVQNVVANNPADFIEELRKEAQRVGVNNLFGV